MGVDPVEDLPVQAGALPVELAALESGHSVANHVAWKPAGGSEAPYRRFEPGRSHEEGFVRRTEDGAG